MRNKYAFRCLVIGLLCSILGYLAKDQLASICYRGMAIFFLIANIYFSFKKKGVQYEKH